MDVAAWLRGLGLEQYVQLFRDNDIDGEILCGMTAEDLKELGISSFGHRRRLLNAITALGREPATRDVARSATTATSAPTSPPTIDAERRQLTVLFCDLVGHYRRVMIPKICARSSAHIIAASQRRWRALTGLLPATWAMEFWFISGIHRPMRTTLSAPYDAAWRWSIACRG
jgi:SAM domain (Sterile alpha motif)